ncbi:ribonuclease H, partial [Trifolium pratense]
MMVKMWFTEGWIRWMRACVFKSSMSVLVNGSPTDDFKVSKGLRQGDPLSPFLFLIAAEGLTGMVKKAVNIGKFRGFKVHDDLSFHILQFADDTIMMGEGTWENVWTIKTILRGFELVSGMKINFVKSKLYGINVEESFLEATSNFLLCRAESIPFKFLGLPVGANPRRLETWKPVVESMMRRLSGWNGRHLSIGGRVMLINSVLSSLPLYFYSFFRAPKGIIRKLVKLQRNFLWGGGLEDKKLCWVKWEHVCLPKEKGGLGVKTLDLFNQALLSKWKWRCVNEPDALWTDLLKFRYEVSFDNLLSWETIKTGTFDSIWWRDVARVGDTADDCWFPKNVSCGLGDGKSISFWKEKWIGEVPLMELYPNLFAIECFKNVVVADRFPDNGHNQEWNLFWSMDLSEFEMKEVEELQILLNGIMLTGDVGDKWRWIPGEEGNFSVKSTYMLLQNERAAMNIQTQLLEALHKLWKNDIPSKVGVFGWRLLLMKLPTRVSLASK